MYWCPSHHALLHSCPRQHLSRRNRVQVLQSVCRLRGHANSTKDLPSSSPYLWEASSCHRQQTPSQSRNSACSHSSNSTNYLDSCISQVIGLSLFISVLPAQSSHPSPSYPQHFSWLYHAATSTTTNNSSHHSTTQPYLGSSHPYLHSYLPYPASPQLSLILWSQSRHLDQSSQPCPGPLSFPSPAPWPPE